MLGCRTIRIICNSRFCPLSVQIHTRRQARVMHERQTLNRLSWSTRLMAASSPLGDSFVWKTTPNEPLPTILHCVYCISRVSPVSPSCTFSRTTSTRICQRTCSNSDPQGNDSVERNRGTYHPGASPKRLLACFATSSRT